MMLFWCLTPKGYHFKYELGIKFLHIHCFYEHFDKKKKKKTT
jgi:hypothetical protein